MNVTYSSNYCFDRPQFGKQIQISRQDKDTSYKKANEGGQENFSIDHELYKTGVDVDGKPIEGLAYTHGTKISAYTATLYKKLSVEDNIYVVAQAVNNTGYAYNMGETVYTMAFPKKTYTYDHPMLHTSKGNTLKASHKDGSIYASEGNNVRFCSTLLEKSYTIRGMGDNWTDREDIGYSEDIYGTYETARGGRILAYERGLLGDKLIRAKSVVVSARKDLLFLGYDIAELPSGRVTYSGWGLPWKNTIQMQTTTTERFIDNVDKLQSVGSVAIAEYNSRVSREVDTYLFPATNLTFEKHDYGDGGTYNSEKTIDFNKINLNAFTRFNYQSLSYDAVKNFHSIGVDIGGLQNDFSNVVVQGFSSTEHTQYPLEKLEDRQWITTGWRHYGDTTKIAYGETAYYDEDEIARRFSYHLKRYTRYERETLLHERIVRYKRGFISGEGDNKKRFEMNLGGSILPAVCGLYDPYITSIYTEVGQAVTGDRVDRLYSARAKSIKDTIKTTYKFRKGTTTSEGYQKTNTITYFNVSTLLDYTNRSIANETQSTNLKIPSKIFSAYISTDENENAYISSCVYNVLESSAVEEVKQGTIAIANMDDNQLFNYMNRRLMEVSDYTITYTLEKAGEKKYTYQESPLGKTTLYASGNQAQRAHEELVSYHEGTKTNDRCSKTIWAHPINSNYTYLLATTTKYDDLGPIKCTMPDYREATLNRDKQLNYTVPFSYRDYRSSSYIDVDKTTFYGQQCFEAYNIFHDTFIYECQRPYGEEYHMPLVDYMANLTAGLIYGHNEHQSAVALEYHRTGRGLPKD